MFSRGITRGILITLIIIFAFSCATMGTSPRSAYVKAEKQWRGLAQDYLAWKNAGMVDEEDQKKIEALFKKASDALDLFKLAVLAGDDIENHVDAIDNLRRELLLELAKMESK